MGKPLSLDLSSHPGHRRDRGHVPPWRGRAIWRLCRTDRALRGGRQHDGHRLAETSGGDTRSHRIEAFSGVILAAVTAQKESLVVTGRAAAHRTRRLVWSRDRLALPRPPRHDLQKQRTQPSRSGQTS